MGARAEIAAALPSVFAEKGEEAVFTPAGGPVIDPCHIFIEFNVALQPDGMTAQAWQRATVIEALLSEIGAEPNKSDTFIYDETTYTVARIIENDGFTVKVAVT
jgi:hypothetical protein